MTFRKGDLVRLTNTSGVASRLIKVGDVFRLVERNSMYTAFVAWTAVAETGSPGLRQVLETSQIELVGDEKFKPGDIVRMVEGALLYSVLQIGGQARLLRRDPERDGHNSRCWRVVDVATGRETIAWEDEFVLADETPADSEFARAAEIILEARAKWS